MPLAAFSENEEDLEQVRSHFPIVSSESSAFPVVSMSVSSGNIQTFSYFPIDPSPENKQSCSSSTESHSTISKGSHQSRRHSMPSEGNTKPPPRVRQSRTLPKKSRIATQHKTSNSVRAASEIRKSLFEITGIDLTRFAILAASATISSRDAERRVEILRGTESLPHNLVTEDRIGEAISKVLNSSVTGSFQELSSESETISSEQKSVLSQEESYGYKDCESPSSNESYLNPLSVIRPNAYLNPLSVIRDPNANPLSAMYPDLRPVTAVWCAEEPVMAMYPDFIPPTPFNPLGLFPGYISHVSEELIREPSSVTIQIESAPDVGLDRDPTNHKDITKKVKRTASLKASILKSNSLRRLGEKIRPRKNHREVYLDDQQVTQRSVSFGPTEDDCKIQKKRPRSFVKRVSSLSLGKDPSPAQGTDSSASNDLEAADEESPIKKKRRSFMKRVSSMSLQLVPAPEPELAEPPSTKRPYYLSRASIERARERTKPVKLRGLGNEGKEQSGLISLLRCETFPVALRVLLVVCVVVAFIILIDMLPREEVLIPEH